MAHRTLVAEIDHPTKSGFYTKARTTIELNQNEKGDWIWTQVQTSRRGLPQNSEQDAIDDALKVLGADYEEE